MSVPRSVVGLAAAMMSFGAAIASAQNYPVKPIRIVTSGVGGGADTVVRILAPALAANLGQQIIIDNRGSGVIPGEIASKAAPDGYTLLLYGNTLWVGALLQETPYDPIKDFAPITITNQSPNILVVHPALPVKNVKQLIALAKAHPGELNYASGAAGSSNHLAAELFKAMAKVNIVRIPYKSGALQSADLIGGQVQLMFASSSMTPHIKSGRLRAVAVTSTEPSSLFPGIPTVAASGLPGYESGSLYAMFAPAKTPSEIINKVNQEAVRYLKTADAKEKYLNAGMETVGSTPEALAALVKTDTARLGKVIKEAGIKGD